MNKTRLPEHCIDFRKKQAIARRTIRETATQHWQEYCSTITQNTNLNKVWKMAKKMKGTYSNSKGIHLTADNKRNYSKPKEKADIMADHFSKVSSDENYDKTFLEHKKVQEVAVATSDTERRLADVLKTKNLTARAVHQKRCVRADSTTGDENSASAESARPQDYINPTNTDFDHLNDNFTLTELKQAIDSLKNNSSPGKDDIPYEFLKHTPNKVKKILLIFYNTIWETGIAPKEFSHSIALPILKKDKDPTLPNSYRPICLTPTISKLMEILVNNRLKWALEKNNLINIDQSGFREGHNTMDQILKLQDEVLKQILNKGHVVGVFIDFEKAYDMVWHHAMIHKAQQVGIGGKTLNY